MPKRSFESGWDSYFDSLELNYVKNKKTPSEPSPSIRKSTEGVDIISAGEKNENSSTLIERQITFSAPPKDSYELVLEYTPENSLVRSVKLFKRPDSKIFYGDFFSEAQKIYKMKGEQCPYVPLKMFSPRYSHLTRQQFSYYLWWRENLRRGIPLKTDSGYILLLAEEIINLGDSADTAEGLSLLASMWNCYRSCVEGFPYRIIDWICDYGQIHRRALPEATLSMQRASSVCTEFFIDASLERLDRFAETLIEIGSSYDYKRSKFATEENLPLFERHIKGAVVTAIGHYSENGVAFSGLEYTNSKKVRDSFMGIICTSEQKYRLECEYCSISCSGELRFLIGDIIKYAENKIRTHLGVKSKLSVYFINNGLKAALDRYFDATLAAKPRPVRKREEAQPYDVLYDIPHTALSPEKAKMIENASWETTKRLVDAFEDTEQEEVISAPEIITAPEVIQSDGSFRESLGELYEFALAIKEVNRARQGELARKFGKLPDALVDEINEVAVELFGDILIEESDGGYSIIEDYSEYLD